MRKILYLASILMLFSAYFQAADIKLRIYMKDGTLQSGNLITENSETFVVLGKDGRIEIPKDKIMFINGKTLKQWGDRPDKLFQTEIIPSEIPNPAYVNNKAVPVPVIEPLTKLDLNVAPKPATKDAQISSKSTKKIKSVEAPVVKEEPKETLEKVAEFPIDEIKKPIEEPKPEVEKKPLVAAPTPAVVVATPPVHVVEKKKRINKLAETPKVEPVNNKEVKKAAILSSIPRERKRRLTEKEHVDFSQIHYQEALANLEAGNRPEAYKNLFVSRALDSRNSLPSFMLGKMLLEDQVRERALNYLSHPRLKKDAQAQEIIAQAEATKKLQEKNRYILFGFTGFGLIVWMPILIVKRKLFKERSKKKVVITADTAEKIIESQQTKILLEPLVVEKLVKEVPTVVSPILSAPPMFQNANEIKKPESLPELKPLQAPPVFNKQEPISPPPQEWLKPKPPATPPVLPPKEILLPVEPVVISELIQFPQPAVVSAEESFKLGRQVDRSIQRANDLASEGKIDLARREYRTCLALDSTCADAHLGLGYLCFMEGKFDLALDHYAYALKVNSNLAAAHYGVGRIYIEMDREEDAVVELRSSLEIDPTLEEARETLSLLGKAI
ncbi:MAG: tetratricopeptide repeat protein [Elusimicrobiota bacterium]